MKETIKQIFTEEHLKIKAEIEYLNYLNRQKSMPSRLSFAEELVNIPTQRIRWA